MSDEWRHRLVAAESGTRAPKERPPAPASSRPHDWIADGAARRCHACGMLEAWEGARYACVNAQFSWDARTASTDSAARERARARERLRRSRARGRA